MKQTLVVLSITLLLVSCQSAQKDRETSSSRVSEVVEEPSITAEEKENKEIEEAFLNAKIVMVFCDFPHSMWKQEVDNQSMYFKAHLIDYNGILSRNAILKMRVYDNFGANWNQTLTTHGLMVGSAKYNYTSSYSYNGSLLSVGKYRIEIETKNGKILSRDFYPKRHLRSDEEDMQYVFSNEYTGKVMPSYKKALERPILTSAHIDDAYLIATFSVNDPRVKNASISLHDLNKEYLGWTKSFYSGFTDETITALNDGEKLRTDGSLNHIKFPLGHMLLEKGKRLADISKIDVTVYDNESPDFFANTENLTLLLTKSELIDVATDDAEADEGVEK